MLKVLYSRHSQTYATAKSSCLLNPAPPVPYPISLIPQTPNPKSQTRHAQTYAMAKSSCFQVLVITPAFVSSPNVCLHLAAALQRPPHHSVCFVDPNLDWSKDGFGRPLPPGYAARLIQALRARGKSTLQALGARGKSTLQALGARGKSTLQALGARGKSTLQALGARGKSTLDPPVVA
jgi:hypothetical protein